MRIVFAGTPAFAAQALQALLAAGHEVALVLTQPDRPAGRGMKMTSSEVKQVALAAGIEVFQPESLKTLVAQERLTAHKAELMVVAAYGLILPQTVLQLFPKGCINIHASLLPRWRGAAPIQRAILAGDRESGVCIMQMEAGLDTGPVFLSRAITLDPRETGASLHDKLAALGSVLIVDALARIAGNATPPVPQSTQGVTYAHKLTKEEARIDWNQPVLHIDAQVRALNPVPVCFTHLAGETLRIWQASVLANTSPSATPGTLLATGAHGIDVACADGVLRIERLQRAGGKAQAADEFLRGRELSPGTVLGF